LGLFGGLSDKQLGCKEGA